MKLTLLAVLAFSLATRTAGAEGALAKAPSRHVAFEGMRVRYKSLGFWDAQAEAFPGRRLLFVDLPGHGASDKPEIRYTMELFARYRGPEYKAIVGAAIDSMMAPTATPELRQRVKSEMLATPQHVVVSAAEGMTDPKTFTPDLIRVPLLAVYAKAPFWTAEHEAYVRKLAPGADFQVMEGVGHFLMMDDPAGFNARLRAFLDGRGLLKS